MMRATESCTEDSAFLSEPPPPKRRWYEDNLLGRFLRRKFWGAGIPWEEASEHWHMAILIELRARYTGGHLGNSLVAVDPERHVTALEVVSESYRDHQRAGEGRPGEEDPRHAGGEGQALGHGGR